MTKTDEQKAYFWLSLAGLTPKKLCAVLSVYSPLELWDKLGKSPALKEALGKHYDELLRVRSADLIAQRIENLMQKGVGILTFADPEYPEALKQKEVCPPAAIYYKGELKALERPCVAIVGTRVCSRYGKDMAEMFARDLALSGVTVVSGMATGIDTFAHEAALSAEGTTVAVLGGGFDHITAYSQKLYSRICSQGGIVLSEYPPEFTPTKYTFPERNRIISGLSRAVIVVEAAKKSGALITADFALEQNRDVYAVPGNITSPKSQGTNALIKDGRAAIALLAQDILQDLDIKSGLNSQKNTPISLDFYEEIVYNLLQSGEKSFDEIMGEGGFKPNELSSLLFSMEMKNIIKRLPANLYRLI